MGIIGTPTRSAPLLVKQLEPTGLLGQPSRSLPILIQEGEMDPNIKRITLIGYLKDGSQATREMLSNIEWEISDPSIGKIVDGYFIPLANGNVEITAKIRVRDGTYINTKATISIGGLYLDRLVVSDRKLNVSVGTLIDIFTTKEKRGPVVLERITTCASELTINVGTILTINTYEQENEGYLLLDKIESNKESIGVLIGEVVNITNGGI